MGTEPTRPMTTSADGAGMEQASTTEPVAATAEPNNDGDHAAAGDEAAKLGDFA